MAQSYPTDRGSAGALGHSRGLGSSVGSSAIGGAAANDNWPIGRPANDNWPRTKPWPRPKIPASTALGYGLSALEIGAGIIAMMLPGEEGWYNPGGWIEYIFTSPPYPHPAYAEGGVHASGTMYAIVPGQSPANEIVFQAIAAPLRIDGQAQNYIAQGNTGYWAENRSFPGRFAHYRSYKYNEPDVIDPNDPVWYGRPWTYATWTSGWWAPQGFPEASPNYGWWGAPNGQPGSAGGYGAPDPWPSPNPHPSPGPTPIFDSDPGPKPNPQPEPDPGSHPENRPDHNRPNREPPRPRTRERKVAAATHRGYRAIRWVLNQVTEGLDALNCVKSGLPKEFQPKPVWSDQPPRPVEHRDIRRQTKRQKKYGKTYTDPGPGRSWRWTPSGWKAQHGSYRAPTAQEVAASIYTHWDKLDINAVLSCLAENAVEDYIIGRIGQSLGDASRQQGRPLGYGAGPLF